MLCAKNCCFRSDISIAIKYSNQPRRKAAVFFYRNAERGGIDRIRAKISQG